MINICCRYFLTCQLLHNITYICTLNDLLLHSIHSAFMTEQTCEACALSYLFYLFLSVISSVVPSVNTAYPVSVIIFHHYQLLGEGRGYSQKIFCICVPYISVHGKYHGFVIIAPHTQTLHHSCDNLKFIIGLLRYLTCTCK